MSGRNKAQASQIPVDTITTQHEKRVCNLPRLKVDSWIRVWKSLFRLHLLEDRHSNGSLVSDRLRDRREARRALALVLALDETVGDAKDGVDDDGVDAFRDLVL